MIKTTYDINALAYDSKGKMTRLFTQHPFLTLKECDNQLEVWEKQHGYRLIISWVQVKYAGGSSKVTHLKEYNWRKSMEDIRLGKGCEKCPSNTKCFDAFQPHSHNCNHYNRTEEEFKAFIEEQRKTGES